MTTAARRIFLHLLILTFTMLLASCSSSDDSQSHTSTVSLKSSEIGGESKNGEIQIKAEVGTKWSAEITKGDDFASFKIDEVVNTASGEIKNADITNRLYLYLLANDGDSSRSAIITFSFEGEKPVELKLTQLSSAMPDDPFEDEKPSAWAELPSHVNNSNYIYVTHSTNLNNGKEVRNYSLCFDKVNRAAIWVAYPYHSIYMGNVGRVEEWRFDPKIPEEYQPNLRGSYSGPYDRGHQAPSADRQATRAMNSQTYYYTNMTPQLDTLNREIWGKIEGAVRRQVCSDTLYVVTGGDFSSNVGYSYDSDHNKCPRPGAYYKVLLRTIKGNSGKAVQDCPANELKAIGYWFDHRYYTSFPQAVSVATIEERTGIKFFPTVPQSVKEEVRTSLWTF